jgi:hypothetical protein
MQPRTTIRDPYSHLERPVVGLQVAFAAALATGMLPRIVFGQWTMIDKLRKIPDTVLEFTGFAVAWDPIAGNFATSDPYVALGTAAVRNVMLPATYSHVGLPITAHLADNPVTRAWIDDYRPDAAAAPIPDDPALDVRNLLHAATCGSASAANGAAGGFGRSEPRAGLMYADSSICSRRRCCGGESCIRTTPCMSPLPGPLDVAKLTTRSPRITPLGITGLVLTRRRRFEYAGGPVRVVVEVIKGDGGPVRVLEQEMERQLNMAFAHDGSIDPFRFFVLDAGASFHLGVSYDHVIAGGDSIVALLKGIAVRYAGGAMPPLTPPKLYPPTYSRLFLRNLLKAHLGQYSAHAHALASRISRAIVSATAGTTR